MTDETPDWFKSSHSDNGGVCVEIATNLTPSHGIVPIRDSKNPTGPTLAPSVSAFAFFLADVKNH
ncbi:DUF397 domain-containing protein [Streptomyces sp. NPDC093252]|uniref:DUF397 domain-containing protein n=1 Tax=Streptomyces sp. NPDC093252 TaxID=3154980 RepID=UPI0034362C4D